MGNEVEVTNEFIEKMVASGKEYCLRIYTVGPNRNHTPEEADRIQIEHLRYLFGLKAEGKLVINGPVSNHPFIKGIGIFTIADQEQARTLTELDPAVKAGRLSYEIYPWFGIPGDCLP